MPIIKCPKCRKMIDPARQMMRCGPHGHDPCKFTVELEREFKTAEDKPKQRREFQGDFSLLDWGEKY